MSRPPSYFSSDASKNKPSVTGRGGVKWGSSNKISVPNLTSPTDPNRSLSEKLFDQSSSGFFDWFPQTNRFNFSPSFASLLGYVQGRLPLNVASLAAHIFPEDYSSLKLSLTKAMISGKNLQIKFRMVTQNAKVSWFQLQLSVLALSKEGHIENAIGCVSNIDYIIHELGKDNHQSNDEHWLRETIYRLQQRNDLSAINDCLQDFCVKTNIDHIVLRQAINNGKSYHLIASAHHHRCAMDITYTKDVLLEHMPKNFNTTETDYDILVDDCSQYTPNSQYIDKRAIDHGVKSFAILPMHFNGKIDFFLSLLMTTKTQAWTEDTIKLARTLGGAITQVAVRQQITETLQTSENRFQNALEASQDGIWDWDLTNNKFYVTPTFLFMLGYDEEFLPINREKISTLLVPPLTLENFFDDDSSQKGRIDCIRQFKHADGHEVSFWVRGNQIAWDQHGVPTRCVGVNTDVSRIYKPEPTQKPTVNPSKNSCSSKDSSNKVKQKIATKLPNENDSQESSPTKAGNNLSQAKILLVEDNPINQQVATGILKRKGITVTIANNGQEAVDLLNASPPRSFDLVLMDMEMPILDGYQATKVLRSIEDFKTLPIIALTAHARDEDRKNCLSLGMNDHVAKPVKPEILYAAIARQIDHDSVEASD